MADSFKEESGLGICTLCIHTGQAPRKTPATAPIDAPTPGEIRAPSLVAMQLVRPPTQGCGGAERLDVLSAFLLQPGGRSRLASGKAEFTRPRLRDGGIVRITAAHALDVVIRQRARTNSTKNPV